MIPFRVLVFSWARRAWPVKGQTITHGDGSQGQMDDPLKIHGGEKNLVQLPENRKPLGRLLMFTGQLGSFIVVSAFSMAQAVWFAMAAKRWTSFSLNVEESSFFS